MTLLVWDDTAKRRFEMGVDRGVFYPTDGPGVSWNGLVSVNAGGEGGDVTAYHLDGVKYLDSISGRDFSARLQAYTYPEEFERVQGAAELAPGLLATEQPPRLFHLAYRTRIGNDVDGVDYGYKLHVVYNIFAVPSEIEYKTNDSNVEPIVFSWDLSCTPIQVSGLRPTAHFEIDTTKISPEATAAIEEYLYGDDDRDPAMPSIAELIVLIVDAQIIEITDNGDGTWTVRGPTSSVTMLDSTTFQVANADATFLDSDTYRISTTIL